MQELYSFLCPNGCIDSQCLVHCFAFAVTVESIFELIRGIVVETVRVVK